MIQTLSTYILYAMILALPLLWHLRHLKQRAIRSREAAQKGMLYSEGPKAQHPHIDPNYCIGCQTCTSVCPEGDVLAMLGGKAVIVNGYKCIGHGLCAEACPVGAITMVMASPSMSADMPFLTPEYETSTSNLFIAGELGGLALIKNAINQGRDCIDTITNRLATRRATHDRHPSPDDPKLLDVLIIGAGPAGISASLRAIENKLRYLTIERDQIGGTVSKYPRQKLVMTSPVQFPLQGKFNKTELSKEDLLAFWNKVLQRADFRVKTGENVENISRDPEGIFTVTTNAGQYHALAVLLAIGRNGTPKKLGVKGEELPKVMYRLIEADHYVNKKILIVGGGDSAVEAAMGLSEQPGNQITLSYRRDSFSRIKERNSQRIQDYIRRGKVRALFNSNPIEFKEGSVVLEMNGTTQEFPNDFVWVFAGGTPPSDFLAKIGVASRMHDMTLEAASEAKAALEAKEQTLAPA